MTMLSTWIYNDDRPRDQERRNKRRRKPPIGLHPTGDNENLRRPDNRTPHSSSTRTRTPRRPTGQNLARFYPGRLGFCHSDRRDNIAAPGYTKAYTLSREPWLSTCEALPNRGADLRRVG